MTDTSARSGEEGSGVTADILAEARQLSSGAQVLPDGVAGLAQKLAAARRQGRTLRVKLGVDPTSSDLHLGHAVVLRALRRFQDSGHTVVLIVGDFTARIGDPTGRNSTRPPLTSDEVAANAQTYLDQVGLILDRERLEVRYNSQWLASMDLSAVLSLAGRVTVNQLIAKEGFGKRIDEKSPVGLHELMYPILQGFDSQAVTADVEIGGTDQTFNILMGRQLQPHFGQEPQVGMFMPIIPGTDGERKMSKSFNNAIRLTDPPSDMFGKVMSIPDSLIVRYFELVTGVSAEVVTEVGNALSEGGNPKDQKEKLALTIVTELHGEAAALAAAAQFRRVHSEHQAPEDMPSHVVAEPMKLDALLVAAALVPSKTQAQQAIRQGAVRINNEQVRDGKHEVAVPPPTGVVLSHGRRKFVRLVPTGNQEVRFSGEPTAQAAEKGN